MSRYLGKLTIASGAQGSNALKLEDSSAKAITIYAPNTLPETVNLLTSPSYPKNFRHQRSNGEDIALAAGRADTFLGVSWEGIKLQATAPVAADRVFEVSIG